MTGENSAGGGAGAVWVGTPSCSCAVLLPDSAPGSARTGGRGTALRGPGQNTHNTQNNEHKSTQKYTRRHTKKYTRNNKNKHK